MLLKRKNNWKTIPTATLMLATWKTYRFQVAICRKSLLRRVFDYTALGGKVTESFLQIWFYRRMLCWVPVNVLWDLPGSHPWHKSIAPSWEKQQKKMMTQFPNNSGEHTFSFKYIYMCLNIILILWCLVSLNLLFQSFRNKHGLYLQKFCAAAPELTGVSYPRRPLEYLIWQRDERLW